MGLGAKNDVSLRDDAASTSRVVAFVPVLAFFTSGPSVLAVDDDASVPNIVWMRPPGLAVDDDATADEVTDACGGDA